GLQTLIFDILLAAFIGRGVDLMTTGHVFIATSLDGFIARKNHALDWLPQEKTEGEDLGYETFVSSVDGLIMGRGTFEKVLTFGSWPYEKPVIVLSKTLT